MFDEKKYAFEYKFNGKIRYIGTNDFRDLSKYNDDNIQLDKILSTRRSFLITQIKNDIENYLN